MSLEVITTISPSTNKPILKRNGLSAGDVATLCENAVEAFKTYKNTSLSERQKIIKKALNILENKTDDLAKELTEQIGRPIAYTAKEIKTAITRAEYLLEISEETLADTPGKAEKGFKRLIRKVPVGPVLIIFAWNVRLYHLH
jgi:acyl-CoA reductase-like NAD-dependent aldehyde dehydrogenase